jgi:predicted nucleotidyltransferase
VVGQQHKRKEPDMQLSWIESPTLLHLEDYIETLTNQNDDLLAIILYGSAARKALRPLTASDPSDIDILLIFNERPDFFQRQQIFKEIGTVAMQHLDDPREIETMFASHMMAEWDPEFVEQVRNDGIILFQRPTRE